MGRFFFLLFLPVLCLGAEFQFWQIAYFNKEITDKWSLVFQTEERWHEVYSNLVRHQNDLGIAYTFNDHWNVHVYFRHKVKDTDEGWRTESENLIDFNGKWKLGKLKIGDRNRFEVHYYGNHWVYRNKIVLAYPFYEYCGDWDFYVFNEFFFRNLQRYHRNRCGAGLQLPLLKKDNKIRFLYVAQQHRESTGWLHTLNILWIESKVYF